MWCILVWIKTNNDHDLYSMFGVYTCNQSFPHHDYYNLFSIRIISLSIQACSFVCVLWSATYAMYKWYALFCYTHTVAFLKDSMDDNEKKRHVQFRPFYYNIIWTQ